MKGITKSPTLFGKKFSSFTFLNITQLLVTLNDSIFRLLVAFSLIDILGESSSSTILFISGVVFVAPFLVFSMPAGELADRYSKQKVIVWTMVAEVAGMGYGIFAMYFRSVTNAYIALFVVALQASVFNPAKYAILPEIVPKEEISKANGVMTLSTYLAIIVGTFLASFITQVTKENYTMVALFCLLIALIGFVTSLCIQTTTAKNPTKRINPLFLVQVFKSLKLASKYPHLLMTVLASSYFLYTASFTQLNMIPYALQTLKITDVQAGYVFLAAALGIGIGSSIVAIISGKNVELGIAVWGAFGTTLSYIILGLGLKSLWIAVLMILSLGIHGGLYIVPLDAYIQVASPEQDRGEIVASGSFLGFVGVLFAALSLGFFSNILHISAAMGYLIIGLLSLGVSIVILFLIPDYLTRFFALSFFQFFYKIESKNQPKTNFYDPIVVVADRYSSKTVITLLTLYPRIVFLKFRKKKTSKWMKSIYSLIHIIPLHADASGEEQKALFEDIKKKQIPVGIFKEVDPEDRSVENSCELAAKLLNQNPFPATYVKIETESSSFEPANSLLTRFKFKPTQICASFSALENECKSLECFKNCS